MRAVVHRGAHEIGGVFIELNTRSSRLLLDAGYPLFLNGRPIEDNISKLPPDELLRLGVLPAIDGLYEWDIPSFAGILISHAHIDHYGLLKYAHPSIPVYLSLGTKTLIDVSQIFKLVSPYPVNANLFEMYAPFAIADFTVKPYLMDHAAFDSAAFEILAEDKAILYSGDFRAHGRKPHCLDHFIKHAQKQADVLFTEGTLVSRGKDEVTITENELELAIVDEVKKQTDIVLFQTSSQNIDRIVSFYRAALQCRKTFVVDIYTANVLHELHERHPFGKKIPYPSYNNFKVFFPHSLTRRIFNDIGEEYANRFSAFRISREQLRTQQNDIMMLVRPSMRADLEKCHLSGGLFIYSMWQGYRDSVYQQTFENWLVERGIQKSFLHTSGHAKISDICRMIDGLNPKKIIPVHTMHPEAFLEYSDKVELQRDGTAFDI